ncbi:MULTISPECIES: hypothetical protein [unclassified Frondihabitans]|uniref:hypothetical protein n=1 Tax=unclassified Frondihabitans TaxID=2626248 RepID=UPI000F4FFE77|nr:MULTISPECIES: hypothetical protein [unclassified Frondihabitans]RPE78274.1 hypothetical protein EDF37_0946 [Frondihabitans sp. PhB153]RPF08555.1 hypothetical protein EDF39_0948 [Frondihabitans sp. PhB161]
MSTYLPENEPVSSTPLYDQGGYSQPVNTEAQVSDDSESSSSTDAAKAKAGAAKEQAGQVAGDAKDAASNVAGTAEEQAGEVASEVKSQAKDLYGQATSQLKEQAGTQSQKVAEGLRSVSDELSSMADKSDGNGVASELVRNLSGRAGSAASWLDGRDPGSLLDEVKQYAARKPGAFIAIAAGAGILAGRLAKSLAAEAKSDDSSSTGRQSPASTASSDAAHAPVTGEPAPGYSRSAESFGVTPVEAGTAHVAPTPSFDDIVDGADTAHLRPYSGDQR